MRPEDRRRLQRYNFRSDMELRILGDDERPVECLDISKGGIGFVWNQPLEKGTELEVVLSFDDSLELAMLVTVVFCAQSEDGSYRIGSLLEAEDATILEELISINP